MKQKTSPFFAYMSRMKLIRRWGLMRNTREEDIAQHSLQVAMVAHALAVIRNREFDGQTDPEHVMALAVYHEAGEVITGDMPTPIKYFNPEIRKAYHAIEDVACQNRCAQITSRCCSSPGRGRRTRWSRRRISCAPI